MPQSTPTDLQKMCQEEAMGKYSFFNKQHWTTGYALTKNDIGPLSFNIHKNKVKIDKISKLETCNCKNLRRKHRIKTS